MTRRPWYKRDGAAFIQGTLGLTLEEKGAYSLCLDLIYANGGPIKDDARWLSGVCGVSMRRWSALRASLIAHGKLFAQDGFLMNARAVAEIASLEVQHDFAVENGSKGGRNRAERSANAQRNKAENNTGENKNNGLAKATLNQKRIDKKENRGESVEVAPPALPPRIGGGLFDEPPQNLEPPPPEEPQAPAPRATRWDPGRTVPPDWIADGQATRRAHALPEINLDLEASKFADHWASKPGKDGRKLDWRLTWLNWARSARGSPTVRAQGQVESVVLRVV